MNTGMQQYSSSRAWWDPFALFGVGAFVYALLSLWDMPLLHPSVWDEVAIAAGVRPPLAPFPGLYRILTGALFFFLPVGTALDSLLYLGRISIAASAMLVYLIFREMLPATLRIKAHMARIGAMVGRLSAFLAALLFACCDPVWRAGQTFTPISLFLLLTMCAVYLFFRFMRNGSIRSLYGCCAIVGTISAESTLGFFLAFIVMFGVLVAVRWARDPDVPLVNPLVDDLVREVVFKRLTYVWALFFLLTVVVNVVNFIWLGGMEAAGREGVLGLLFEYFRGAYEATRGAASGSGWLFIFLMSVAPFVLAIKLLPRAWDDDKFLPWVVSVVYVVIGVFALSQLLGVRTLMYWTWLGTKRTMVSSDALLAFSLALNVSVVAFALAVFGVDAICRNYRRIAQQNYPESMLEIVPARLAKSLGDARILRKRIFWSVVCLLPIIVLPWRMLPTERRMAKLIRDSIDELLLETKGCDMIFTDGSFDEMLELQALRLGRPINCLSLMAPNTPRSKQLRMRVAKDAEDKMLLETDAASALRTWVETKPERLTNSAVQIGFEMWKRARKPFPPMSGLTALPGGIAAEERSRALKACTDIANEAYALAKDSPVDLITDIDLRRKFPFVLWRLSRLMHMRSRVADEAGNRSEAFREAAHEEELMSVNANYQKMRRDMNWLKQQNGGQLSPREGLVIGLARADFALAGRFAEPVLAADPDDPRANFALGMMYCQDEQFSRAEKHLTRCLVRRPDDPAVLNNLAIVQTKLGKLDEAEANVRRVVEKFPHLHEAKKTLEKVLTARKAKEEKSAVHK